MVTDTAGTLALVGGEEWGAACRGFDRALLEASGGTEVVVVPTAAAFERPAKVVERAQEYWAGLGGSVRPLMVLHRSEAEDEASADAARRARFLYFSGGSPMHLRSVLKGSRLWEAVLEAYRGGAVLAASGSGAVVLCDPMIDPRGGAYTVGLGLLVNLAVLPHHDTVPQHLRERAVDLLPVGATLVGIDEQTALVRSPEGAWRVEGPGTVTVYGPDSPRAYTAGPADVAAG